MPDSTTLSHITPLDAKDKPKKLHTSCDDIYTEDICVSGRAGYPRGEVSIDEGDQVAKTLWKAVVRNQKENECEWPRGPWPGKPLKPA
jgi:hypothetical protein